MRLKLGKKLTTASYNSKFTFSNKKRVNIRYANYFMVDNSDVITYKFCFFVNSEQTNYFKIGKFCLFMMYSIIKCKMASDANRREKRTPLSSN